MRDLLKIISEHLIIQHCLLCDFITENKQLICNDCFSILPHHPFSCDRCGLAITETAFKTHCGHCISNSPPFDHTVALFDYAAPIPALIWKLKFHGDLSIAQFFGQCWIDLIDQFYPNNTLPDFILPVPLHHKRLKERGFNQALEIAKPIGKHFNIPIDTRTCIRIKNTQAQSTMPANKRKNNMDNAFALSHATDAKHVAILDDVMTTGNTVSEISALLKIAGVERVDVWCCARA